MKNDELDEIVKEAEAITAGNYKADESTRKNHAKLMALQIKINGQLIKTIRTLDEKNSRLQRQIYILTILATVCAVIALLK